MVGFNDPGCNHCVIVSRLGLSRWKSPFQALFFQGYHLSLPLCTPHVKQRAIPDSSCQKRRAAAGTAALSLSLSLASLTLAYIDAVHTALSITAHSNKQPVNKQTNKQTTIRPGRQPHNVRGMYMSTTV